MSPQPPLDDEDGRRTALTGFVGAGLDPAPTLVTGCPVFLCDPHSPWQRGSNENTNGPLRQYFPKGRFDFRTIGQEELDAVAAQHNGRPRQTLDWDKPAERLDQLLFARTG